MAYQGRRIERSRVSLPLMLLLGAAVAAAFLAGPASGQVALSDLEVEIVEGAGTVLYPGETAEFPVEVTVYCEFLESIASGSPSTSLTIELAAQYHALDVRVEPDRFDVDYASETCLHAPGMAPVPSVHHATLIITVPERQHAVHFSILQVQAWTPHRSTHDQIDLAIGFVGDIEANGPDDVTYVPYCSKATHHVPFTVFNDGNGELEVTVKKLETSHPIRAYPQGPFAVAALVEGQSGVLFETWDQRSGAPLAAGTEIDFDLDVEARYRFDPHAAPLFDQANFTAIIGAGECPNAFSQELPAPGLPVLFGALAALGAVLRRVR